MDEDQTSIEDPWGSGTSIYVEPKPTQFALPQSLNEASISPGLSTPRFFQEADDPLVRAVVDDSHISEQEKTTQLQSLFSRAASNGDIRCVRSMLHSAAREYIDIDAEDEDGNTPLIHAACFGHADVVRALLDAGAEVDKQDHRQWSALMWATSNSQPQIVRLLLDHGASPTVKTGSGRTALDFVGNDDPDHEIESYLRRSNGSEIGTVGVGEDWYDRGFGGEIEEQFAESERKRRMMMESAFNLEEFSADEEQPSFVWERCLPDQMFVFTDSDLPVLLDFVIIKMLPQRSTAQKPIPANFIFLAARYAHYYQNNEMLKSLFDGVLKRIEKVIKSKPDDMTIHAFWISNTLLLLHYFRKDPGLMGVSVEFQAKISELLQESYLSLLRDAQRRVGRVLDSAILDNETIQGLDELTFGDEWRIFRHRPRHTPKSPHRFSRTPSPRRRAEPSPRNVTSLLSSIQFILETYDIHAVITAQIQAQLFYWLGAELFNRILCTKKYQSRSKAMQIRLNVSALEDWLRMNVKNTSETDPSAHVKRTATDIGREFLGPLIQLLQWFQVLSSLGDEEETFRKTVGALDLLTPSQLLSAANNYRLEVGEHPLPKKFKEILKAMEAEKEDARRKARARMSLPSSTKAGSSPPPRSPVKSATLGAVTPPPPKSAVSEDDDIPPPSTLLLTSSTLLPFALPTTTDMITSYGSGIGGVHREKYIPTLPHEFMEKLDNVTPKGSTGVPLGGIKKTWIEDDGGEERELADRIAVQGSAGWGQ